jgi:hypothetical protein
LSLLSETQVLPHNDVPAAQTPASLPVGAGIWVWHAALKTTTTKPSRRMVAGRLTLQLDMPIIIGEFRARPTAHVSSGCPG